MKRNLIILSGIVALSLFGGNAIAQQTGLVPDQNPRYQESATKYAALADSLTKFQSTTIQDTYKAYDWYTAREERRQQRRELRHQERMYGGYNNYSSGWGLYSGYSYPYYSSFGNYGYGYGNRWGGWGNRWGLGVGFSW